MSEPVLSADRLKVINYPHQVLRLKAPPIKRVDTLLKQIAERMIELMYEHHGVGLAATQVKLPLRLFVWDPKGDPASGQATVYLNPTITRPRSNEEAEEGCLSIPGINANVIRAKTIHMNAYDIHGREIDADFSGFEARILQHETDHLDGVLFIDRLTPAQQREHAEALKILETEYDFRLRLGDVPSVEEEEAELKAWMQRYT